MQDIYNLIRPNKQPFRQTIKHADKTINDIMLKSIKDEMRFNCQCKQNVEAKVRFLYLQTKPWSQGKMLLLESDNVMVSTMQH